LRAEPGISALAARIRQIELAKQPEAERRKRRRIEIARLHEIQHRKPDMIEHARTSRRCRRPKPVEKQRGQPHTRRSTISFLSSAIALAGLSPFGQALAQFMMVWHR